MRGADTFTESLFSIKRLGDFVPAAHPLRSIREMVNEVLKRLDGLFAQMYEADVVGGRPSMRRRSCCGPCCCKCSTACALSACSWSRCNTTCCFAFIGLSMDDAVWVTTVFSKNRERLIEHDAVIEFFNQTVELAHEKALLSNEHFSVDGTLIQAWASHKSFVRKDGGDGGEGSNFKAKTRCNDTHESSTDVDARLYRKGKTASEQRFMGHTLIDNRHGLIVNGMFTQADGHAEREAAKTMLNDITQLHHPDVPVTLTVGADKGYDAEVFIEAVQEMNVIPHVAQNTSGRKSAVPSAIAQTLDYALSQQKRKLIEQGFGWAKTVGNMAQVMVSGLAKVDMQFMLNLAGYNLVRMRTLGQIRPQVANG